MEEASLFYGLPVLTAFIAYYCAVYRTTQQLEVEKALRRSKFEEIERKFKADIKNLEGRLLEQVELYEKKS